MHCSLEERTYKAEEKVENTPVETQKKHCKLLRTYQYSQAQTGNSKQPRLARAQGPFRRAEDKPRKVDGSQIIEDLEAHQRHSGLNGVPVVLK